MENTVTISDSQWQTLLDALSQLGGKLETLSYFLSVVSFVSLFALLAIVFWKTVFRE